MLRLIVALPLIAVLAIFLLSNRVNTQIGFLNWNTTMPLSVAVLMAAGLFFLLGAMIVWFGELRQRRRARRAEARVRELELQLAEARAALTPALPAGALPVSTAHPHTVSVAALP